MSKLTKAFHNSTHLDAIEFAIKLVDDKAQQYSNDKKLDAAVAIVNAIDGALPANKMFDDMELAFLQGAISALASFFHQRLLPYESHAPKQPPPPLPPVGVPSDPSYNVNRAFPIPTDADLKGPSFRYVADDEVFQDTANGLWSVTKAGEASNPGFSFLRAIIS